MRRWIRVLLGPLPATVLLLPMLYAGGLGAAFALVAGLVEPGPSARERWAGLSTSGLMLAWIAAASAGVLALWAAVLADTPAALRQTPIRWWLATGLALGLLAAGRWLWMMSAGSDGYAPLTWGVWFLMLAGPLLLGSYYLVYLVRGSGAAA
jgi:hypothetical protein